MPSLLALFASLFLSACSLITPQSNQIHTYEASLNSLASNAPNLFFNKNDYLFQYFSPWNNDFNISKTDASWPWRVYSPAYKYFGETLQPRTIKWFDKQFKNANLEKLGSFNQNAIITTNRSVRAMPTNLPIFKNPKDAGEGYPFDYNQNSAIGPFTPVKISHYSKDLMWVFIQADSFFGWIEANSVIPISKDLEKNICSSPKTMMLKQSFFLGKDGFYNQAPLGTIVPLLKQNSLSNFTTISVDQNKTQTTTWPLKMKKSNILSIAKEFLNEPYGWGGMHGHRDCSSFTKDFFAPFGVWLPRNSKAQYYNGSFINLENLPTKEKIDMINEFATPFLSLIYMPGHIMLYLGDKNGTPLVMHSTWGVKTSKFGIKDRHIIGKTIISDLNLGENIQWADNSFLPINRIIGFSTQSSKSPKDRLLTSYPKAIKEIKNNKVIFYNGVELPFSTTKTKTPSTLMDNPDIQSQFLFPYPKFAPINKPSQDPGRVRNEEFFKALYGQNELEVEKSLIPVIWLPKHTNQTLFFNQKNGAAKALQQVSIDLDKLPLKFLSFVDNPAGTYNYRTIAGTKRLSAHSFGIAIDINTDRGDYWRWSKTGNYKNQIPKKIVDIFEKHGFIWGGRWKHFDTFHFEYRPELTLP